MEKSSIEQLKESVAAIRESQVRLKAQAAAICALNDDDDLVPSDQAEELKQAIENNQQLMRQLYETGHQLSLCLGTKMSEISAAIQACENAYNLDRLRAVVLDYLRITAHSEEHRATLKRTKKSLCGLAALPDDHIETKLEPYKQVVSVIKRGDASPASLPKELFQLITDKIDYDIAFAIISRELSYDAECDVSEYMNGSSPLLTFDPGTTENAPATPAAEIQAPGQEPEAEPPPTGTETVTVPEPVRRWPSYSGYVSEAVTVNCMDRPEQPTLDEIINLEKQNHDTVMTLWNSANEKLIPVANDNPGSRILSPEAVRLLTDTGLLTGLTITDKSRKKDYLTLSSKGWACFSQSGIAGFLAKKRMPLIIPDKLRISNQAWTPLLAARAALIHDYCRKSDKNYVMWKADSSEMLVAKTAEQESVTLLAGLFRESLEEADLRELAATLDDLGDAADVLILVRQHDDITILASELKAMSAQAAKAVLFAVEDEAFAVYYPTDPSSKPPHDDPDHKSATISDPPENQAAEPEASAPDETAMLTALNPIKMGPASASKFKNDIAEIAKRYKAIYAILPMLTNLGALEREQVVRFGICLGCFTDDDTSEQIHGALDLLTAKGLLAHYQYLRDGMTIDAYGLTRYCYGSMKKQEVYSLSGWLLSLGNRHFICESKIVKDEIERTVKANADLLEYVRAAKAQYDQSVYVVVQKSIKWLDGCYVVDCFWEGIKYHCCLFTADLDPQSAPRDNLILIHDQDMSRLSGNFKRIFVVDTGKICLSNCSDDREQTESTPCAAGAAGEGDSKAKGTANLPAAPTSEKRPAEHHRSTDIPTDEAFCEGVQAILNAPFNSAQELITAVSHALLLARTAGFNKGYEKTSSLSQRLQLATSIFFDGCSYCSTDLTANFTDTGLDQQAITLAACCFAMLTPAVSYDYALYAQIKTYFDDYETCFPGFGCLKNLFSKLLKIQTISQTGFSPSVIALLGSDDESRTFVKNLRTQARVYLDNVVPKAKLRSLPIMYGACFGSGSDLFECMSIVAEHREDDLDFVKSILAEYCTERDNTLTIEISKIEDRLDKEWELTNPKNKFRLEYDARVLAIKQFRLRLELLLNWLEHLNAKKTKNDSLEKLHRLRHALLDAISAAENDSTWQSAYLASVLRYMLHRIKAILNGQPQHKIFTDLLFTGVISVDANQQPIFDEVLTEVRFNEPWRNVIRHIETEKKPVSEIKNEILGVTGNESELFDNLNQLKMLGLLLGSDDEDYVVSEQQLKDAKEAAKLKTEKFRETLELAYTKNQINETEKETLAGIVRQNEAKYFEIGDFACWRRFLEGLEMQIEEYATYRQENLRIELNARKNQSPKSTLLEKAAELLEKDRNFAVTEEYINRFDNGETALSDELDANIIDTNYFSRFISPDVFEPLFDQCRNRSGSTLRSFGWTFLERRLPKDWTSRQRKDSEDLISAWPVRKDGNPPGRIQTLFSCLGLTVTNVSRASGSKEEIYKLTVTPTARSKADYLHPIAAYGTQLKSPVNVIVLYGNYPAKQLVDTITSLDLGGIPVVLIDRPVDLANRRLIGQMFYTQTSRQNPFLLIDQVLLLFLAMHQITERLPALLKCTLPFSSYQPFVQDSGSIPDEMFCGRAKELARIIDPNGACVVYGGRQLGKTALLQRTESRCMDPESRRYAVYVSILKLDTESKVVEAIAAAICKKTNDAISISSCHTLKTLCDQLGRYFRNGTVTRMHLLIDEVDDFLAAIAAEKYTPIQPFVELRRETTNNFKVVLAGLHNVCRAKNATAENGIFGQFGTPLCIKPLSPTDALQLLSRPLRYLGFQIDRYPHLETILTNTNYYPGILQFFGYMLVETLSNQYTRYYQATNGNPPFTLHDEQLGAVMNSADLNRSIKDKFRWSLELDKRYFMIARCITMLYHYHEDTRHQGSWLGFPVEQIIKMARDYDIHCLANESPNDYVVLLDEMVDMGILSKPGDGDLYRLRRRSFVDIIGDNIDSLDADIMSNNEVT